MTWDVEHLARSDTERITLRNPRGDILKYVDRSQVLYLYAVKRGIERAAETDTRLYIIRGDSPNASAGLIDGRNTVLVNFAMLDMVGQDMNQWAALIGHEIAHLKLGHQGKRMERNIPLVIAQTILQSATDSLVTDQLTDLIVTGISSSFSREDEREADYLGAIWAVETGYDPFGAVALHEKFNRLSRAQPLPFLSSHPSGSERIRNLRALARRLSTPN